MSLLLLLLKYYYIIKTLFKDYENDTELELSNTFLISFIIKALLKNKMF